VRRWSELGVYALLIVLFGGLWAGDALAADPPGAPPSAGSEESQMVRDVTRPSRVSGIFGGACAVMGPMLVLAAVGTGDITEGGAAALVTVGSVQIMVGTPTLAVSGLTGRRAIRLRGFAAPVGYGYLSLGLYIGSLVGLVATPFLAAEDRHPELMLAASAALYVGAIVAGVGQHSANVNARRADSTDEAPSARTGLLFAPVVTPRFRGVVLAMPL